MSNDIVHATSQDIKHAFTEWDRRFRADPDSFRSQASSLLNGTPESYGDSATPYFLKILEEVKRG